MSEDSYSKPPKFMSEDGKWHYFVWISARPHVGQARCFLCDCYSRPSTSFSVTTERL